MKYLKGLGLGLVLNVMLGCAHNSGAVLSGRASGKALVLTRVVLYQNRVGYFERQGQFDGDVLTLQVRKDQTDDLLKSLTIIDRSNGKAVSVSMPLEPKSWANAALSQGLLALAGALRGSALVIEKRHGFAHGRLVAVADKTSDGTKATVTLVTWLCSSIEVSAQVLTTAFFSG